MLYHQLMLAGSAQPIISIYHANKASVEYTEEQKQLLSYFALAIL
jgi:hypothetical protein